MFTLATALHAFVTETLRNGRPFDREGEAALARDDHAGERGGQFGSQGEAVAALVLERVDLVGDFLAGLALEQFHGFDDGGVVGFETAEARGGVPGVEDGFAGIKILGVKVAHPARWIECRHMNENLNERIVIAFKPPRRQERQELFFLHRFRIRQIEFFEELGAATRVVDRAGFAVEHRT